MRRFWDLYVSLVLILSIRRIKKTARQIGESLKRLGRKLVAWGADANQQWSRELFLRCYLIDAEVHVDGRVYRGPVRAMFRDFRIKDILVLRFNWLAVRDQFATVWEYAGSCTYRIERYGKPMILENGDVYFGFVGGYAVLFLGKPQSRLAFAGHAATPREFAWY